MNLVHHRPSATPAAVSADAPLAPLATVRIAVDCMGGDHGAAVTLPACKAFLAKHPQAELVLVGSAQALSAAQGWERCTHLVATEVVTMDDPIEVALRRKRDSSMRVAILQVKDGAHACVSAGNTGALMALARFLLKTVEGIDRPAIAAIMPNRRDGFTTVLDLGANVDCTPEHLLQFAVMGSALVAAVDGKPEPTVGLLNIGEEAIKGSEVIKRAGELLRNAGEGGHISFYGNVEGNDIFKGTVDVVVCDGFVGNVMLKTSEGLASMLSDFIRQEFTRNLFTKLAAVVAMSVLKRFKHRVSTRALQRRGAAGPAWAGLQEPRFGRRLRLRERAWHGLMMPPATGCLTVCTTVSAPRSWLRSRPCHPRAPRQYKRHEPQAHGQPFRTALLAHHRHRQLPAAAALDQ
jgi:glycerol-3-phosphate acyltransferase PlsX